MSGPGFLPYKIQIMMKASTFLLFFLGILSGTFAQQNKTKDEVYFDFSLELEAENRYFFEEGAFPGQKDNFFSLAIEPKFSLEWNDSRQLLNFHGFARWDAADENRTHWDIRELYWQTVKPDWELSLGVKKIFWGVTESAHLVDIINQTDVVESFDGEEKLGQPMAHFSYVAGFGTFDVFAMPYFRKIQFPGRNGRFRFAEPVEKELIGFENQDLEEWYPSLALRFSNSIGVMDYGFSYFHGVGREPYFSVDPENGQFNLFYPVNNQFGVELQAITGPFLWKLESIYRSNRFQEFTALAAGFEYTFGNIKNSGIDIGVLAEYLFDDRGDLAFTGLDNDLFFGSRLAFNDVQSTEILIGGIFDLEQSTRIFSIEASRRLGQSWKATLEARIISRVAPEELFFFFGQDSFGRLAIAKFF